MYIRMDWFHLAFWFCRRHLARRIADFTMRQITARVCVCVVLCYTMQCAHEQNHSQYKMHVHVSVTVTQTNADNAESFISLLISAAQQTFAQSLRSYRQFS